MKFNSIALLVAVLLFADSLSAQGVCFWSPGKLGNFANANDLIFNPGDSQDSIVPFTLFLYYSPDTANIDSFNMDLKFPHYEVLDAEVFNFDIFVAGTSIGSRWDQINEISLEGDTVLNLGASNSADFIGGLNTYSMDLFSDGGFDITADAFLVASVTLLGVTTEAEYLNSTTFSNDGVEVFPELLQQEIDIGCVLDPPFGSFGTAYTLPTDSGVVGGSFHCLTIPLSVCDGTIWNTYLPTADGLMTCNTFGASADDTILEIYTGTTLDNLELIAFNDDAQGTEWSRVTFPVEVGQTYSIRILPKGLGAADIGPSRLCYEFLESSIGDLNNDSAVDLLDVSPFVASLSSNEYQPVADINFDGEVNLLDVQPFIDLLTQ